MLGAIYGSARSMDRATRSMDRKFAQGSMDRAPIWILLKLLNAYM